MEKDRIVIFGASGGAIKVAKTLKNLGIDYLYFVDNDKNKWGTTVEGKAVDSPERLYQEKCRILIASDYQAEIEKQLCEMGLLDNLVIKEELIMNYVECHIKEFDFIKNIDVDATKQRGLIFGLEEGLVLGGIESFTFMLAKELKQSFEKTVIFTKRTDDSAPAGLESNIRYFDFDYDDYWDSIVNLVKAIVESSPCVIIDNWQNQILIAVSIIKKYFPEYVRCISIVHNDKVLLYRKAAFMQKYMDIIAGVSRKINHHLADDFGVDKEKIRYKESPVEYSQNLVRNYTVDQSKPLEIGYAARVTKFQKRADLLIPLMMELNKRGVNYHLNIAGDGNYFTKLKERIAENNLANWVTLYGSVARDKMPEYWKKQDVFLSVSDFEGASISMLEAMSYGTVPVVTAVSGTEEFIQNGKNGFLSETSNVEMMSGIIELLEKNRERLTELGGNARETVKRKAGKEDYIAYMKALTDENETQKWGLSWQG